ncbi:DUF1738 domain-containing protein [Loktanella sp. IMCC34160]|uniref:ArdC family protein n=1 Tax=Loktanella sp. IMCC34160 TaxID=2510646 RepID=UPI00101C5265|nr:zincin-like metallopeptidase domain-containing protein [Loktanella sp. IMCC34160]RYG90029.1 DUF1738 domain-containing protein [Loktanella sp. IMCC34160]
MATAKFNVQDQVTGAIIAAIEAGTPPWRKPWTGEAGGCSFPHRANGEPYRGINVLLLWAAAQNHGYTSAHWFTYRQAQENGGQVRKGEKSNTVVKYGTIDRETDEGEAKAVPYTRAYRVFNADQIDGLPEHFYATPAPAEDLGTEADPALCAFFEALGVPIITTEEPRAYYSIDKDQIHMPPVQTFYSASEYFGTLAHECAHSTGHRSRLDRFEKFRDRKAYAFEELIAEIAACILGAKHGFKPDFEQSAAYVEGWLKALGEDNRAIFRAASEAQKAVDMIEAAAEGATSTKEAA